MTDEVLWVRLEPVDKRRLDSLPNLKVICCPCTGLDHIDLAECKRRGIKVLSLRDTNILPQITATAEHTIGLILSLVRKIPAAVASVKRGEWERYRFVGRELKGMRCLVVGAGRVGSQVRSFLTRLGSDVRTDRDGKNLNWYLNRSELVTVHVDLNDSSRGLCNADFFQSMQPGSYFINTSRGAVVSEPALLSALRSGHLAGVALDVVCGEPDLINPQLIAFANEQPDRLIITPHIGGCAVEAIKKAEVALAARLVEELAQLGIADRAATA